MGYFDYIFFVGVCGCVWGVLQYLFKKTSCFAVYSVVKGHKDITLSHGSLYTLNCLGCVGGIGRATV